MYHINNNSENKFAVLGKRFVEAVDSHNYSTGRDVMDIMSVLDLIVVKDGYVVDVYKCGDYYGTHTELYCRRKDADKKFHSSVNSLYRHRISIIPQKSSGDSDTIHEGSSAYDDDMLIDGTLSRVESAGIPSVFEYLNIPFTSEGIWQAFLLVISKNIMPLYWHGGYMSCSFIFDMDDAKHLNNICSDYFNDTSLLPSVILNHDKAIITYSYWNEWKGLCKCVFNTDRNMNFSDCKEQILVKYSCNILF